jgi:hypothetical protein
MKPEGMILAAPRAGAVRDQRGSRQALTHLSSHPGAG